MADNLAYKPGNNMFKTSSIGQEIDSMVAFAENQRKGFERKWYDNNLFDDGYHFQYVSRQTGKIVNSQEVSSVNLPQRAIPKASRQIRGIANLLQTPKYVPVVYPQKIDKARFMVQDPMTGKMVLDQQSYIVAKEQAKAIAKKQGTWLEEEWKEQFMKAKLTLTLINAAKNSVAYVKVWPDDREEKIMTSGRDAFDLYLVGTLDYIEDSPFVIEAVPKLISEIKADKRFDPEQLKQISPDNKYASSEIKQAYIQSRFGSGMESDNSATLILKEAFIKCILTPENVEEIMQKTKDPDILAGKEMGSVVMRHCFSAGGVWLMDEYLDMDQYPYIDFRYEPGPMYQKAPIENFIPANKSLDIVASRLEKWANTMVTGTWLKKKGENFEITNVSGGQVLEYTTNPPVQGQMAPVPNAVFQLMQFWEKNIEEQGASTSALGVLPEGVKSGVAIESVKATEFANLEIASEQLRDAIERISKKMFYIADNYFISPQSVSPGVDSEEFDVIGARSIKLRQRLGIDVPEGVVPLSKDTKVKIEVESGLGFTMEGKKESAQQITGFIVEMAKLGFINPQAAQVAVQTVLDTYQFGSTQEFMEALDMGPVQPQLDEEQLNTMKIAMLEVLKDAGVVGEEKEQQQVNTTKVGVMEAINDITS